MTCLTSYPSGSLRAELDHEPVPLGFGTSGRRGQVVHLTQIEVYLNALAELDYLKSLPIHSGGVRAGDEFYYAYDLRPSSTRFVQEEQGRGEIAQTIGRAIGDAGLRPVNLGPIPTPALASYALARNRGCMMVTGSHIPFDRNGYKTYSSKGELLKEDEAPITARVAQVRHGLYRQPLDESDFDSGGMLRSGHVELPPEDKSARAAYVRRYVDFMGSGALTRMRVLFYEHSAVGRDLLVEILELAGAEVVRAGRSNKFVPIDTENFDARLADTVRALAVEAWRERGPLDAVISTDGDSDRPLVIGVEPMTDRMMPCRVRFFGGDLVGTIVAEWIGADAVVVPISCNDGIDRGPLRNVVEPKTRIGSPHVITGMENARAKGRKAVCGFEANGGFLTGSDIWRKGRFLAALPTRDAVLPILGVLACAREEKITVSDLFDRMPRRFSRAALLRQFPRPVGLRIVDRLSPANAAVREAVFTDDQAQLLDCESKPLDASASDIATLRGIRSTLAGFFTPALGFGKIVRLNYTDGVRTMFENGDVAHVRPSGNADELRVYTVANTQERADAIAGLAVAEPDGVLRQMERALI